MKKIIKKNLSCKISAIILTKNEAPIIDDCLKSLLWVDEIIVVDHCSTDETLDIAKKYKAKIVKVPLNSTFSDRRNLEEKKAIEGVFADKEVLKDMDVEDIIKRVLTSMVR